MYCAPKDVHAVFGRRAFSSLDEIGDSLSAELSPSAVKQPEMDELLVHEVPPPSAGSNDDDGAHLLDFFVSGWHMLIRSLLIQVTAALLPGNDDNRLKFICALWAWAWMQAACD